MQFLPFNSVVSISLAIVIQETAEITQLLVVSKQTTNIIAKTVDFACFNIRIHYVDVVTGHWSTALVLALTLLLWTACLVVHCH